MHCTSFSKSLIQQIEYIWPIRENLNKPGRLTACFDLLLLFAGLCNIIASKVHYCIKQTVLKMFWSPGRHHWCLREEYQWLQSSALTTLNIKKATFVWGEQMIRIITEKQGIKLSIVLCHQEDDKNLHLMHWWTLWQHTDLIHTGQNIGIHRLFARIKLKDVCVLPEWNQHYCWRLKFVITYIIHTFTFQIIWRNLSSVLFNLSNKEKLFPIKIICSQPSVNGNHGSGYRLIDAMLFCELKIRYKKDCFCNVPFSIAN